MCNQTEISGGIIWVGTQTRVGVNNGGIIE